MGRAIEAEGEDFESCSVPLSEKEKVGPPADGGPGSVEELLPSTRVPPTLRPQKSSLG